VALGEQLIKLVARVSTAPTLGREARAFSVKVTNQGLTFIAYAVVWRYGKVKAALQAFGLAGTVDATQVFRLAQKQQKRIMATLSDTFEATR
jgi:hypothetical protein